MEHLSARTFPFRIPRENWHYFYLIKSTVPRNNSHWNTRLKIFSTTFTITLAQSILQNNTKWNETNQDDFANFSHSRLAKFNFACFVNYNLSCFLNYSFACFAKCILFVSQNTVFLISKITVLLLSQNTVLLIPQNTALLIL